MIQACCQSSAVLWKILGSVLSSAQFEMEEVSGCEAQPTSSTSVHLDGSAL